MQKKSKLACEVGKVTEDCITSHINLICNENGCKNY